MIVRRDGCVCVPVRLCVRESVSKLYLAAQTTGSPAVRQGVRQSGGGRTRADDTLTGREREREAVAELWKVGTRAALCQILSVFSVAYKELFMFVS